MHPPLPLCLSPGRENEASFLLFLFGGMGLGGEGEDELEVDCRRVTSERSYHKELGVAGGVEGFVSSLWFSFYIT